MTEKKRKVVAKVTKEERESFKRVWYLQKAAYKILRDCEREYEKLWEEARKKYKFEGAVVRLDRETGEIVETF